jgi:hypothetical protein
LAPGFGFRRNHMKNNNTFTRTFQGLSLLLCLVLLSSTVAAGTHIAGEKPQKDKLTPRLQMLAEHPSVLQSAAAEDRIIPLLGLPASGEGSLLRSPQGDVMVYIWMVDVSESSLAALKSAGARITHVAETYNVVTAYVTPQKLAEVANTAPVKSAREALAPAIGHVDLEALKAQLAKVVGPQTPAVCPGGNAVTEGVQQMGVDVARDTYGVDGSGVMVGALSDSFDVDPAAPTRAITDVLSGDLPGPGNPCGYTEPVTLVKDGLVGYDEGRAMLQIVHDIAPNARLAFATATGGMFDYADQIRALRTAGADIIVDDVAYPDEPAFQDGPIAVAIADVVKDGALYFTASGNNWRYIEVEGEMKGISAYEAPAFRPMACPTVIVGTGSLTLPGECHDFDPLDASDNTSGYTILPYSYVRVMLHWTEPWFGVQTDFNIYAVGDDGAILAASENDNIDSTQQPFEMLTVVNMSPTDLLNFSIVIDRVAGTANPRVKLALSTGAGVIQDAEYYHVDPDDGAVDNYPQDIFGQTLTGHAGANEALSISAVPHDDPDTVELFPAQGFPLYYFGPVITYTMPAPPLQVPETRQRPVVAATNNGVTTFFGRFHTDEGVWRFRGTSAAAPHAAGVAALMLEQARLSNVPLDYQATEMILKTTARPIMTSTIEGAGAGLIDAPLAVGQLVLQSDGLNIITPTAEAPAKAGALNAPRPFTIQLDKHVSGLAAPQHFTVAVGTETGTVAAVHEEASRYVLEVLPPVQAMTGTYTLSVTAHGIVTPSLVADGVEYGTESGLGVFMRYYVDAQTPLQAKSPIKVIVKLFDKEPIRDAEVTAVIGPVAKVGIMATQPRPNPILKLYDDGSHGDGAPGDGVYANTYAGNNTVSDPAGYPDLVHVVARGNANNNLAFNCIGQNGESVCTGGLYQIHLPLMLKANTTRSIKSPAQEPSIENLDVASTPQGVCSEAGKLFSVNFDYQDTDGGITLGQASVSVKYEGSPSGATNADMVTLANINVTGDAYSGSVQLPVCVTFGDDVTGTLTISLFDAEDNISNELEGTVKNQ